MKRSFIFIILVLAGLSSCSKKGLINPDVNITLTADTIKLVVGQSVEILSKDNTSNALKWSSADTSIVTVSQQGMITGKSVGQSVVTVSSQSNLQTASCVVMVLPVPITGNITSVPGVASDIGIGAEGSVYIIGTDSVSETGGYSISKLVGSSFVKMPECAGTRIAVSQNGVPWVVNKSHLIFQYTGVNNLWQQQQGTANDIGIGADGSVFIIGTTIVSPTGGYDIMKYNGAGWDTLKQCAGIRIAVSPQGVPWVVNKSHIVFKYTGGLLWQAVPGVVANDIGIGADGAVYVTSVDTTGVNTKPLIYKYNGAGWTPLTNASGVSIAVSPDGQPWWVDKINSIYKLQ